MKNFSNLLKIILSTLRISFLSFGGGNAAMGVIEREFVEHYQLVSEDEFIRSLSMTNIFPGPVIVNTVTLLGYKSGGFLGALFAFIISVFPGPILVVVFVSVLYRYISTQTLLKMSLGVIPVVVSLLLEFVIHSYKKHKEAVSQKTLYFGIFFFTLLLLVIGIHIAIIFFILLILLWIIGVFQRPL